jgi:hypothetical protein
VWLFAFSSPLAARLTRLITKRQKSIALFRSSNSAASCTRLLKNRVVPSTPSLVVIPVQILCNYGSTPVLQCQVIDPKVRAVPGSTHRLLNIAFTPTDEATFYDLSLIVSSLKGRTLPVPSVAVWLPYLAINVDGGQVIFCLRYVSERAASPIT